MARVFWSGYFYVSASVVNSSTTTFLNVSNFHSILLHGKEFCNDAIIQAFIIFRQIAAKYQDYNLRFDRGDGINWLKLKVTYIIQFFVN